MGEEHYLRKPIATVLRVARTSLERDQVVEGLIERGIGVEREKLYIDAQVCLDSYPEFHSIAPGYYSLEEKLTRLQTVPTQPIEPDPVSEVLRPEDYEGIEEVVEEEPVKRKRGRPRKKPLEEIVDTDREPKSGPEYVDRPDGYQRRSRGHRKKQREVSQPGGLRYEMHEVMTAMKQSMNPVRIVEVLHARKFPVRPDTLGLVRLYLEQYPEFQQSETDATLYKAIEKKD